MSNFLELLWNFISQKLVFQLSNFKNVIFPNPASLSFHQRQSTQFPSQIQFRVKRARLWPESVRTTYTHTDTYTHKESRGRTTSMRIRFNGPGPPPLNGPYSATMASGPLAPTPTPTHSLYFPLPSFLLIVVGRREIPVMSSRFLDPWSLYFSWA